MNVGNGQIINPSYFIDPVEESFRDGYLKEYHYHEKLDENKIYEKSIVKDFGHGEHRYKHKVVKMTLKLPDDKFVTEIYVYVEEILTEEEAKELEPYCQCYSCKSNFWIRPCACCSGCLGAWDFRHEVPQHVIDAARKFKATNPILPERREITPSLVFKFIIICFIFILAINLIFF